MTKLGVLKYLLENNALGKTVSCWNASLKNDVVSICHTCANCIERDANLRKLRDEYAQELTSEQYTTISSFL